MSKRLVWSDTSTLSPTTKVCVEVCPPVRYARGGAVAAETSTAKGKTSATVSGLEKGERYRVEVRPLRASGDKTYNGVLHGTWAKEKSGPSLKAQSAEVGPAQNGGLIAVSI